MHRKNMKMCNENKVVVHHIDVSLNILRTVFVTSTAVYYTPYYNKDKVILFYDLLKNGYETKCSIAAVQRTNIN